MSNLLKNIGLVLLVILAVSCTRKGKQSEIDPDDTLPGRTVIELNPDSTPKIVYYYKVDANGNLTSEKIRDVHYRPGKKKYVAGDIKNDLRHGEWKAYQEDGEYKVYRDNGAYLYIGHYDHGICVGEWKKFDNEGKVIKTVIADSNTVVCGSCEKCKALREKYHLKHVTF